jgi:hypothetical protein
MSRIRLCVGPLTFCILDATFTLIGQPEAYWSGDFLSAREANPLGRWLLHVQPLAFVVGVTASLALYALLLVRLPANLARVAAFLILFFHSVGASTWLLRWGILGNALAVLLLLGASRTATVALRTSSAAPPTPVVPRAASPQVSTPPDSKGCPAM